MERKKVTLEEFMIIYFETVNANCRDDKYRLTYREVLGLVSLMLFNFGKNPTDFITPFKGEGRKIMQKKLGMSPANYGLLLKTLCDKKFLIKGEGLSTYHFHFKLVDMFNQIMQNKVATLSNSYEIIDDERSN